MLGLDRHPFAVKAHFKESLVLSYSLPLKKLRPLVPACLEIDSYQESHGFLAVALVQTQKLRPHFFPPPWEMTSLFWDTASLSATRVTMAGSGADSIFCDQKRIEPVWFCSAISSPAIAIVK